MLADAPRSVGGQGPLILGIGLKRTAGVIANPDASPSIRPRRALLEAAPVFFTAAKFLSTAGQRIVLEAALAKG